jgi:hypothetical protein
MPFRKLKSWRSGATIPMRYPPGTLLDFRDFNAVQSAHGKIYGPFDQGRQAFYDGKNMPEPPRERWPDDIKL